MLTDTPKSLGDPDHRADRLAQLDEPHVRDLTRFVKRIHREIPGKDVPYFDPADGGVDAVCLYVLEAPGRNAAKSGFVSRNNPDETAKNWLELNKQAGVDRKRTIMSNIVPWYIGSKEKIRPTSPEDIEDGWPYLLQLIDMLPQLRVVVLVGTKAQRIAKRLSMTHPSLHLMKCPHPSPKFVNRKPENRDRLLASLREVATVLNKLLQQKKS
jgi:uracil-DNA glycosylase